MDAIIEVSQLTKTFGRNKALDDISLKIHSQGMVALLGPSGCGKSTLMRHLSGLLVADKQLGGEIKVLGETVQRSGRAVANVKDCRAQAGYIFQQFNLVERLSVLTNVLIGALNHTPAWRSLTGRFTAAQKAQAMAALDRVGMAEFARQRVSTLSGGQQQRVAIARALMQNAKIIFADEPIASLDPESSRIVMELLRDINEKEGIPVVVTLHQVEHALNYCEHIIALRKGRVFYQGPSDALTEQDLQELYRGRADQAPQAEPVPVAAGVPPLRAPQPQAISMTH